MKKNFATNFILFIIISIAFYILGFTLYSGLDPNIPFYRLDMDQATVLDAYYLGSNLMPNHLSHPGVGLNFIIIIYQYILHNLNLISSIGFSDLSSSVNLFFPYAEKMYYLRSLSPILIFFTIFFSATSLTLLKKGNKNLFFILIFIALATMNSLWVHALQIRTEIYVAFFMSILIFLLILLRKTNYKSLVLLFLSFLFVITCVFTKLHFIVSASIFFILFYIFDYSQNYKKLNLEIEKSKKNEYIFYYINLFIFFIFFIFSFLYEVSPALKEGAFRSDYNNLLKNHFFILFVIINIVILYALKKNHNSFINKISKSLVFFITALNIFFISHLFLPLAFEARWEFLLLNFKLFFLSKLNVSSTMTDLSSISLRIGTIINSIPLIYENFLANFTKHYFQYFSLVFLCILLFFNYFKNNDKVSKFSKYILAICIFLLFFHLLKFTRAGTWNHREAIHTEYIIFLFIVITIFLTLNFSKIKSLNIYFLYTYLILTSVFSIFNLNYLNQSDPDQNYNFTQGITKPVGGEKIIKFIEIAAPYSYDRNINFEKIINNNYNSKEDAHKHAHQSSLFFYKIKSILNTSHDTYYNHSNLMNVGIVQKNSKLNLGDRKLEVISFSPQLENIFLINFQNLPKTNESYKFVSGNPWNYRRLVFYDRDLSKSSLPCYGGATDYEIVFKNEKKFIHLDSYKPIQDCKTSYRDIDKNLFYTFVDRNNFIKDFDY